MMLAVTTRSTPVADTDTETLTVCRRIQQQALSLLASALRAQGCYAKAEPLLLRALALMERHFGNEAKETADSLNNLGVLYKYWGKYDQAEPYTNRRELF
jgi:tetratricopeptide (TPR) repeat protein